MVLPPPARGAGMPQFSHLSNGNQDCILAYKEVLALREHAARVHGSLRLTSGLYSCCVYAGGDHNKHVQGAGTSHGRSLQLRGRLLTLF